MPAFNEEASIAEAVSRCHDVLSSLGGAFEIIVVNDGSFDETAGVVKSLELDCVFLVSHPVNLGKGASLIEGWRRSSGQLVCFLDGDLDIDCRGIGHFASRLQSRDIPVDVVVGSKTHKDSVVNYPLGRRIQSRAFKFIVRRLFGLSVGDTQTGLKMFKRAVLDDCLPNVQTDGFAFDLELLALAQLKNYRLVEEPVHVDFKFSSTVGPKAAIQVFIDTLRIRFRLRRSL